MDTTTSTALPPPGEPSSFRLILTLGIAGFFSGLLLVGVYLSTLPAIQQHRAESLRKAIFQVLPGCTEYQTLELREGQLAEVQATEPVSGEGEVAPRVYAGYNAAGEFIGFAIQGEEPGFQDLIGAIFGYQPEEKVIIGFEVLESKETPGLGDKIIKDENWRANFEALQVEPVIEVVKEGQGQQPNQVEAITGATISSKAIVRLLEKELAEWKDILGEYMKENSVKDKM
jgi:electron transport complex protein RnfG